MGFRSLRKPDSEICLVLFNDIDQVPWDSRMDERWCATWLANSACSPRTRARVFPSPASSFAREGPRPSGTDACPAR
eukprot:7089323-Lingulodinium_polyedra.AAC.1